MFSLATFFNTIQKTFTMSGRATRTEFWNFHIMLYLGIIVGTLIFILLGLGLLALIFIPLLILAGITNFTLAARRCHDLNKSAWHLLICLIPFIGSIFYYIYLGGFKSVNDNNIYNDKS